MRPAPIQPSFWLVGVGNWQFLSGVKRDDLGAARREDHFLLDARGRNSIGRRTVRLDCEHHAGLELDRLAQRREPRYERPLVQAETEPVAEIEAERVHLAREADLLRLRQRSRDLVARHTGLEELDGAVHPLARLAIGRALRRRGTADIEGAV